MIYLSGTWRRQMNALQRPDLGLMLNPRSGNRIPDGAPWAFENDCYKHEPSRWLQLLPTLAAWQDRCLFTPMPDVVGDCLATWDRWHEYMPLVVGFGFPLAYVSQDGETRWPDSADCLFIGGSTSWKLSEPSYALAQRAKDAGLWIHMGRVNSMRRITAAWVSGVDSVDGTILARAPDRRLPEVCSWLDRVNGPQQTFGWAA